MNIHVLCVGGFHIVTFSIIHLSQYQILTPQTRATVPLTHYLWCLKKRDSIDYLTWRVRKDLGCNRHSMSKSLQKRQCRTCSIFCRPKSRQSRRYQGCDERTAVKQDHNETMTVQFNYPSNLQIRIKIVLITFTSKSDFIYKLIESTLSRTLTLFRLLILLRQRYKIVFKYRVDKSLHTTFTVNIQQHRYIQKVYYVMEFIREKNVKVLSSVCSNRFRRQKNPTDPEDFSNIGLDSFFYFPHQTLPTWWVEFNLMIQVSYTIGPWYDNQNPKSCKRKKNRMKIKIRTLGLI